ncbi:MAG: Gfo/Idh/MocA family oxidoreductase [Planctomycetes bacterium]|nr:Gfo/Idh/MocA family oxidoreductase [Planctomycetota bacterium]
MAKRKPITTCVVGLGRIGWSHHAKLMNAHPGFEIVACVDPLKDRREEAEGTYGCATFARLGDFLKSDLADLVVVCTRSTDHGPHTIAALKSGRHVLVEKPMCMNVGEADRMIRTAKKARKVLTIHQSARHGSGARFIQETIDSGILGDVFFMRMTGHSFFRRNDWQQLKKFGGGYLNNNGSHSVDFCIQLLGSPVKDVWGDLKHTVTAGDADDWMKVVLRGKNGRVIELEQSYACAFPQPNWLICGTCGTMEIRGRQARIKYFDSKRVKPIKVDPGAAVGRRYGNEDVLPWQEKTVEVKPKGKGPRFYDNLYDAIRTRKKPLITPESVREQIRVLDLVRKSAGWRM